MIWEVFSGLGMPEFYAFYLARILVVAVVTYLTIVFGELVPKRIGMCPGSDFQTGGRADESLFLCRSPFVWVLSKSTVLVCNLLGVRKMTAKVTEEEIRLMVQESARDGMCRMWNARSWNVYLILVTGIWNPS